jgi:hypothetical protein
MLELFHLTKRPLPLSPMLDNAYSKKGLRNQREKERRYKGKRKIKKAVVKQSAKVVTLSLAHPHEGHHGRNEDS